MIGADRPLQLTHYSAGPQIWKIPSSGNNQAIQVTKEGGEDPVEGADGASLYYLGPTDDGEIWQKHRPDGEEHRVDAIPALARWNGWQVTKGGIYFVVAGTPSQQRDQPSGGFKPDSVLRYLNFSTGHIATVATLAIEKYGDGCISVSKDGRTILYVHTASIGSEIMLVENFH